MNISVNEDKIIIDDKIVFKRKKTDLKFFKSNQASVCPIINKNNNIEKKKLPAPVWCLNELNNCMCNQKFANSYQLNLHQEYCLFDQNNIDKEKEEENNPENNFYNFDDATIDIIESYERKTGDNLFMQILLGQIDFKLIDKIESEYYEDNINDEFIEYDSEDDLIIYE